MGAETRTGIDDCFVAGQADPWEERVERVRIASAGVSRWSADVAGDLLSPTAHDHLFTRSLGCRICALTLVSRLVSKTEADG